MPTFRANQVLSLRDGDVDNQKAGVAGNARFDIHILEYR